jgi:chaperonin GroES
MSPKIKLTPTAGYLLLEPMEAETKTSSGIYLPDNASEKPQKAKVLAVGPSGCKDCGCGSCDCDECSCSCEAPCKVGDVVIYKKWGGSEVKVDGKEYLFAKFEDILAVVSE